MSRKSLDLWVGFFVVIGFAALLFLALRVGNLSSASFAETYRISARFDNIGGLKARGPVKSAGVVVGRVAEIHFDPEVYGAVVTMTVDGRYRFPKDTVASIMTSGLLGEQYVGFDPGSDKTMLVSGDAIAKTQSAAVLEKLISQFTNASEIPDFEQTYPLTAKFDNVGGLKSRGPVKSAGVVVGRVTGIYFDPEAYEAVVTMTIDSRYKFPRDTFASIMTSGLIGEQYIGLDAGGDEKMLAPGDTLSKTQSAVVLEKLIGQFLFSKASETPGGK